METLDDYLRPNLDIISIGLNPSVYSVKAGFYFARPQNRFWQAFNASRLADQELIPNKTAMTILLRDHGIGFTDLVKRPTAGAAQIKPADFRKWAPLLRDKLIHHRPYIAWFHGKMAYRNYLLYAEGRKINVTWGQQVAVIGRSAVFVTPNPSPANAVFSLAELIKWYSRLKTLRDELCRNANLN
jgi:double-stranded uracil-DNA glycosylase